MKKKALTKDFFMEIKKTKNRFLSILLIAALGVAFFAGVRAAAPDMKMSADLFYDKSDFMDIRVLGGLGITEDDLKEIQAMEGVEKAKGGYTADVLCNAEDVQLVVRMMSDYGDINKIRVIDGRMPENTKECLADEQFLEASGYKIGDTIQVKSGTEDKIEDTLSNTEYKIVGSGASPHYLSLERGTSKIGNGELSSFMIVLPECFSMEVYTEAVVRVEGAEALLSGSEEYEDLVKKVEDRLEDISGDRCTIRYEAVYDEAEGKLADAREEIEENQQKLVDAEKELDDGDQELADARVKLADARIELDDGWKELNDAESQLLEGEQQAAEGKTQLAAGWDTYHSNKAVIDTEEGNLNLAAATLEEGEIQYQNGKEELNTKRTELETGKTQLAEGKTQLSQGIDQLEEGITKTEEGITAVEEGIRQIEAGLPQVTAGIESVKQGIAQAQETKEGLEQQLAGVEAGIAAIEQQLEQIPPEDTEARQPLEAQLSLLQEQKNQLTGGIAQAEGTITELQTQLTELETRKTEMETQLAALKEQQEILPQTLEDLKTQLAGANAQMEELNRKETELAEGELQLNEAETLLNEKGQELEAGKTKLSEGRTQLEAGKTELAGAKTLLEGKEQELADAEELLRDSRAQFESGKADLLQGEEEYTDGQTELEENAEKLADGRKEFEEQKEEADEEIADALVKIEDGEKDLDELEVPEWFILNRDYVQTYVEYEQDSERIAAIGEVFPAIFFLVAALICLTTMTRMVEEERTQIGTLKALGYGKWAIARKYLFYALSASLLGSLFGLVAGQKILPPIIIQAYGILYTNMPDTLSPLHMSYSVSSTLLAIACTTLAAGAACYKELMSTPAKLMRPAAPKSGKRVLLEKIGVIWNHLSFTNKSTVRNLFRYKKRFLMTVLGIGGCMGLLLVGFGLKDSIRSIGIIQYDDIFSYQADIILEDKISEEEKKEVLDEMEQDEDIKSFIPVYKTSMEIENPQDHTEKSTYVTVPYDTGEFTKYVDLRDRVTQKYYDLSGDGIIISEKLSKLLHVKEGDTVILKEEEKDHYEVKISHVVENYFMHYCYISPELYERTFGKTPEFREYLATTTSRESSFEENLQKKYMSYDQVSEVSFITKTSQKIADMLKSMDTIIYVLVISAGLLAFIVLYNLNNINISERLRELATLKVLGFYDMEVSRYVLRENVCLTVIGCILGIFIGGILHRFVILTAETDIMMFGRQIRPISFVYSIILTLIFSGIVNFFMHFRLKKVNMVESMKSVE